MSQRTFGSIAPAATLSGDSTTNSTSDSTKSKPRYSKNSGSTTSSLVFPSVRKSVCDYCGGSHYSDECSVCPDVNSRRVKLGNRCLSCLREGHRVKDCQYIRECYHCRKPGHHRSLCHRKFGKSTSFAGNSSQLTGNTISEPEVVPVSEATNLLAHGEKTILQTALAPAVGPGTPVTARLLLDTGCTRSFVTTSLCRELKAKCIGEEHIAVSGFSDKKRKTSTYKIYEIDVVLKDGSKQRIIANATDNITCPIQKFPIDVKKHPFVTSLSLAEPLSSKPEMVNIDILVGGDYYYNFVGSEQVKCSSGLVFLSSSLGYVAAGRLESEYGSNSVATSMLLTRSPASQDTSFDVERFWKLEDVGIRDHRDMEDDEVALQHFNSTVRTKDGRYEVQFPWRKDAPELADNYCLAKVRLMSLHKRLVSTPDVLEKYNKTIEDQRSKGVIEPAPVEPDCPRVYYIPHHCVITPQKTTTKLRVVYDASSKANKNAHSLNDSLYRGPVMVEDLCALIVRFRIRPVAVVSDIEKAFLQVGLQKVDRDVTRFLWLKDITMPPTDDNLVVYRFCRVPFGVKTSPSLLGCTVKKHLTSVDTPVSNDMNRNAYVDNVLGGANSTSEAMDYYCEAKEIFNKASMNLREWFSNDKELMQQLPEKDRGSGSSTQVLGLTWHLDSDELRCSVGSFDVDVVSTKRMFLQALASAFDPCGYVSPITIRGKMLMQEIWKNKYEWDDHLPSELLENVRSCLISLKQIPVIKIDRQYGSLFCNPDAILELHCFCDASTKAYSAVVYLRAELGSQVEIRLIFFKVTSEPLEGIVSSQA